MANPIVALLGDKVQGKQGEVDVSSLNKEGVLGLYFSAHWCPPCRGFTPQLDEWYLNFKKSANGGKLELVYVSADQSEGQFKEYYETMSWLAVPFDEEEKRDELSSNFGIRGIPTLVFVDSQTGETITKDGRTIVGKDPEGIKFPWKQ